jgi:hypothetical protein
MTTLFSITQSNIRWGDRVEEDSLTHSSDSEGEQTQCPWTSSKWMIGPPSIASVSESLRRQRVGSTALEHQILIRRRSKALERNEPHLATNTGILGSGSNLGESYLARG